MSSSHTVSCGFRNCEPSIASRVVVAIVDQLCAESDVGLDVLESLEFPLHEVVGALTNHALSSVTVSVEADTLTVRLGVARSITDEPHLLGDCDDVVRSFFAVEVSEDSSTVALTGSLR